MPIHPFLLKIRRKKAFAIGAACLLALLICKEGLKLVFSAVGFTWLGSNAIRYFAVVLMASVVWPLTFPWFARLGAGKEPRG